MFGLNTVLVSLSLISPVATSFFITQAHTEKKVGHDNLIKSQSPWEDEYKKYWLNGGKCQHLFDEKFVRCNCK